MSGKTPLELKIPPVPAGGEYLKKLFMELHGSRPSSGMGISPILFSELHAYQQVFNVKLSPFEIETIFFIDRAALAEMSEK